ncbi:MAG: putative bifunctional diguanylate cyclase/phosphodiesterase [Gammaproteobacteria bacterium]
MEIYAQLITFAGVIIMCCSLLPAVKICQRSEYKGWKLLLGLIILFIAGYLSYMQMLSAREAKTLEMVVAAILLGGSCFVLVMTVASFNSLMAAQEQTRLEHHSARHDSLTGLPNRTRFQELFYAEILVAEKEQSQLALLMIDLDRFKEINDTLGHAIGDEVLRRMAERFKSNHITKNICRLGGDEFVVSIQNCSAEEAEKYAHELSDLVNDPFNIDDNLLLIGMSVGIAMYPKDGHDEHALLKCADIAMYEAKKKNVGHILYDEIHNRFSLSRLTMISRLKESLANEELQVVYQPIYEARSNQVKSVETLLRWPQKDGSFISPVDFIEVAEQHNFITQITRWVIKQALTQMKVWQEYYPELSININLSALDMQDNTLQGYIMNTLRELEIPANKLICEITESAMMKDINHAREFISNMNKEGVRFSIDDYGTGYSSFSLLRELSSQELKIDRSFVIGMENNPDDYSIVKSTIELAHNIDRIVIAEGIENQNTCQMLIDLGCDALQGYYLCRPNNADEIFAIFKQTDTVTNCESELYENT